MLAISCDKHIWILMLIVWVVLVWDSKCELEFQLDPPIFRISTLELLVKSSWTARIKFLVLQHVKLDDWDIARIDLQLEHLFSCLSDETVSHVIIADQDLLAPLSRHTTQVVYATLESLNRLKFLFQGLTNSVFSPNTKKIECVLHESVSLISLDDLMILLHIMN